MKKKIVTIPALSIGLLAMSVPAFAATPTSTVSVPSGYSVSTFAQGGTATSPDDITRLGDHIFIGYQNGVGSKGELSKSGVAQSTIVEYDTTGKAIQRWNITGKCDGLTADTANNRIIATVNEDGNSSMYIITPGQSIAQHLSYTPDPSTASTPTPLGTGGGTDAITFLNGKVYVTASAPSADANGKTYSKTALFEANIDTTKGTVTLTSALKDNDKATNVITGKSETLNLSDPDSTIQVPQTSPKFAGDFMLDSQGDQELVFIHNLGSTNQSQQVLPLSDQVDDVVWATNPQGALYISDNGTNKVYTVKGNFKPGTVFASVGTTVGTLDLSTGKITPFITGLSSSHGMTFIPGSTSTGNSIGNTNTLGTTQPGTKANTPTTSQQASHTNVPDTTGQAVTNATSPVTGIPFASTLWEAVSLIAIGIGTLLFKSRKMTK